MAKYTIELRDVIAHHRIFDFQYPFYDAKKRYEFEESFIRHFYFREIGVPTVEQFKHYLEDKMLTVFPYYNELFNTAAIEYSILDNYNITETFERSVEGKDKSNSVVSNIGRTEDNQRSETDENREGNSTTSSTGMGTSTVAENNQETETGNSTTERSGETSKNGTSNVTDNSHTIKRFLDTPMGKLSLTSGETYLTTLNEDDTDETHKTTSSETGSESGSEEANTLRNVSGSKNTTGNTTDEQTETVEDSSNNKTVGNFESTRLDRQDGNTRHESVANRNERYELTKKGNIGVDTDADMMQKHINLQKTLKKIELMFFEECEDLFMMVY